MVQEGAFNEKRSDLISASCHGECNEDAFKRIKRVSVCVLCSGITVVIPLVFACVFFYESRLYACWHLLKEKKKKHFSQFKLKICFENKSYPICAP